MKVRIISALVAICIAIPFIFAGGIAYAFAIGALAIGAFIEMWRLKKSHSKLPFVPSAIALCSMLMLIYTNFEGFTKIYGLTYALIVLMILLLIIPIILYKDDKYTCKEALYLIGVSLFLGIMFHSFITVRDAGLPMFFFLVLIPVCTDTFAYIIGSKIGKHKVAPLISPNKSWEGCIGGLIFGTILPCVFYYFVVHNLDWKVIVGALILSMMGQIGDLVFSKIKRENNIKDFSNIMPGHGGILDRLDSTIFIFLTYLFLTTILF